MVVRLKCEGTVVRQSADDFRAQSLGPVQKYNSALDLFPSQSAFKKYFLAEGAQKNTDGSAGSPSGGKSCYNQVILLLGSVLTGPVARELVIELPLIKTLPILGDF